MQLIVISLPTAHDRRERISQRFAEVGLRFEFMDAVDAGRLTEQDFARIDRGYGRRWGLPPLSPTEFACWLSHVHAIRRVAAGPDPMTAIFEDDAIPRTDLPTILSALEICPVAFDLVSLSRRNPNRQMVSAHPLAAGRSMVRVRYSEYGAEGYVITRDAAAWLVRRMTRMRVPVDVDLLFFWVHRINLWFLNVPAVDHDVSIPSQLAMGRTAKLVGWRKPRLRRMVYRLQMGARKRIGFRRLVKGKIRPCGKAMGL